MTDREKLIEILERHAYQRCYPSTLAAILIANGVTVKKYGAWIEDGYNVNPFVCSYCGHEGCYSGNFNNKQYYYTNYCPHCGAKMEE